MNLVGASLLGLALGTAGGVLYFYGLWLTVSRLEQSSRPGLVFAASALARVGLAFAALWGLTAWAGWQPLPGTLAGVLLARTWLVRRLGLFAGAKERAR